MAHGIRVPELSLEYEHTISESIHEGEYEQLHGISSHLGDKILGMSRREFLDWTEVGRHVLNVLAPFSDLKPQ